MAIAALYVKQDVIRESMQCIKAKCNDDMNNMQRMLILNLVIMSLMQIGRFKMTSKK